MPPDTTEQALLVPVLQGGRGITAAEDTEGGGKAVERPGMLQGGRGITAAEDPRWRACAVGCDTYRFNEAAALLPRKIST